MPELPEVETIKRGLSKFCVQKRINRVEIRCEKSFLGPKEIVEGAWIEGMRRYGKALIIDLSNGVSLMIHLRMTGQLIYRADRDKANANCAKEAGKADGDGANANYVEEVGNRSLSDESSFAGGHPSENFAAALPNKQTRVIFELKEEREAGGDKRQGKRLIQNDNDRGDGMLYFNDQRKFGFVKVLPTAEVEQDEFIASLAPEPWQIKPEQLYKILRRRKNSPIKAVILDQKVIAGIGNIYADEALFDAKIHPKRLAGSLSLEEARKLIKGACKVMDASINSGGSTMATYVRADGTRGDYLEKFAQVFRNEGKPCPRCGTEIEKIRVAGRGTHICPKCQRLTKLEDVNQNLRGES